MENSIECCTGSSVCHSLVMYACTCRDPYVFLCKECIHDHLAELCVHSFISLDQARLITRNRMTSKEFAKISSEYNDAKIETQNYIRKIQIFKLEIQTAKNDIINGLDQKCNSAIQALDSLEDAAKTKLIEIKRRMKNFTEPIDDMLIGYRALGLESLIQGYQDKFEIHKAQVLNAINFMISFQNPIVDLRQPEIPIDQLETDRYIYIPKQDTRILLSYDSETDEIKEHKLNFMIDYNFADTSTCLLPDGCVLITGGFFNNYSGSTYRFNPYTGKCVSLKKLKYPRGGIHLYLHGRYVYAFGGYFNKSYSKHAERIEWCGETWETLPEMKRFRACFGSFYSDQKLYLIGGEKQNSVEYYDFRDNKFTLLSNVTVREGGNFVGVLNDKVYIINKDIKILSKDLHLIENTKDFYSIEFSVFSNTITQGDSIIFYCKKNERIYYYDDETEELEELISFK